MFPYTRDPPTTIASASVTSLRSTTPVPTSSLRSAKPSWHRAPQKSQASDVKQRFIVFVAGGMTNSEMREVYQASATLGKDIFLGTVFLYFLC